ncbi:MAG: hypothetical protein QF660_01325, partial [Anaerolineales bacterium]|nr:hypothetical protein [Anaerolineales bacterium]
SSGNANNANRTSGFCDMLAASLLGGVARHCVPDHDHLPAPRYYYGGALAVPRLLVPEQPLFSLLHLIG